MSSPNYIYITPDQMISAVQNIYGEQNATNLRKVEPQLNEKGDVKGVHFTFDFYNKFLNVSVSNIMGYIQCLPKHVEMDTFLNRYNQTLGDYKNEKPIAITPEILVDSLKQVYGEQYFKGPSNIVNGDHKVTFDIEFFEQHLKVVFCSITGNIVSFPNNQNFNDFSLELNRNYTSLGDKLESRLPKSVYAKSIEQMSKKPVEKKSIMISPKQAIDGLIEKFGIDNVQDGYKLQVLRDGTVDFHIHYFGYTHKVHFNQFDGVEVIAQNLNLEKHIYEVQETILSSPDSLLSTTVPTEIKITPQQVVDFFNTKYGAGNVSEPINIVDNGNGHVTFTIDYFGCTLDVTFNNGIIVTHPFTNNNFVRQVYEENKKYI